MLKLLKHANITERVASYSYDGKHNFLMPLAPGGSLANILNGYFPSPFDSEKALLVALCGLGSAIYSVHHFVCESLNFRAIGCHHDLKPANILVDDSKLILADFGLSRLKELPSDSATPFKEVLGDCLAPECEDIERNFKPGIIHRRSDIWPFGCILPEILTHRLEGPEGVRVFKEKRRCSIPGFTQYRFYDRPNQANAGVTEWLIRLSRNIESNLPQNLSGPLQLLLRLIKDMLVLEPGRRPSTKLVETQLRFVALNAVALPFNQHYQSIVEGPLSFLGTEAV